MTNTALLLSDDLIDRSRINGTARAQGSTLRAARSLDELREMIRQEPPAAVVIDLHHPGLVASELMNWLCETCSPVPRVIAYGSHVDVERLKAARAAGCTVVLPRSAFFEQLSGLLSS